MSVLEWIAVSISIVGVILTIRRSIWCWIVNFVAYALYAFLFFEYKLYGETFLQLFFMVMAIYGFWTWQRGRIEHDSLPLNSLNTHTMIWQILLSMGCGGLFGWALHQWTDAAVPLLDAQLAALSLLATYWTSQRYIATWVMWICIDIAYVAMFSYKALYLTAFLYLVFIGLAFIGLKQWRKLKPVQ